MLDDPEVNPYGGSIAYEKMHNCLARFLMEQPDGHDLLARAPRAPRSCPGPEPSLDRSLGPAAGSTRCGWRPQT